MTKTKLHKILGLLFGIAFVLICTVTSGMVSLTAYAESDSVQSKFEKTNIMSDLKGSVIGGKEFDVKDFPHNDNSAPQVISLVEFCYSYYKDKQADYGLYVYIYNACDKVIDTNTERNKIELTYGDKPSYGKYSLRFLNYSKDAGLEGRFYKFKIMLSAQEHEDILKTIKPDERVYKISGIELSIQNKVTEFAAAQVYTYSGYANGYGSELAENDTLSCMVDGLDKYISLDVRSTYWRPDGAHADGDLTDLITRDTLHSVYFSVPNDIITEYGEMTAVHATWLNAYTSPIFVTGNKTVYDAVAGVVGQTVTGGDMDNYADNGSGYAVLASKITNGSGLGELKNSYYNLYYGFNIFESQSKHPTQWGSTNVHDCDKIINKLCYAFYADNGDADDYVLPSEKLLGDDGWFVTYTDKHGGAKINDRYSADLFDRVDEKFTDVNIRSTDTYKLQDKIVSDDFWEILFGDRISAEHEYEMQAIQKVTLSDMNAINNKKAFCNKYYIAESDHTEFSEYVTEASAKNETVYLFRYYQSEYVCAEAHEAKRFYHSKTAFKSCMFHSDCPFGHGYYEAVDTNAYIAQMWVQLDFDIIDLTFTKDNVVTIIPVVLSPMDIVADAEPPISTTPEHNGPYWWQIFFVVAIAVIVFILVFKFAPSVFVVIGKAIAAPFKAIGAVSKTKGDKVKPLHEKNKQERKERKEQKQIERKQERQRKYNEKQRLREERRERKDRERKSKRIWKLRYKERKRIRQHRKESEKIMEKQYKKMQRQKSKGEKIANKKSGRLTDDELAAIYYSEFYDKFGEAFPDDDPFDY